MERILFVLPLEKRFICPVHNGVLREPMQSSLCGHNVCKACVQNALICSNDGTPISVDNINKDLQDDIDSLLCYCKYGVMVNSNGELIADPKGCDHIIKYGNRAQHEAVCEFRDVDFIMIDNMERKEVEAPKEAIIPPPPPVLIPCGNKDDGCFFLAASRAELDNHLNECSYERVRRLLRHSESRVQLLEREIQLRDEEIAELRNRLNEQTTSAFAKRTLGSGKELFEEFMRILEEEVPQGMSSVREQVLASPAFVKSSSALSSFKTKVIRKTGQVRQDLADIHPLDKLPGINNSLEKLADMHPLDKLIAILSTLKNDIVSSVKDSMPQSGSINNSYMAVSVNSNSNNNNNVANNTDNLNTEDSNTNENKNSESAPSASAQVEEEDEEEVKKLIAASLASYEEEKRVRMERDENEAAAIAAAAALSLRTK